MGNEYDIFQKEYTIKSTTDAASKPPEIVTEEKTQNYTITGQVDFYDRQKPYPRIIKAKVIK